MPSIEVNGVRINYMQMPCESGERSEDLVLVHGLATNLAFWYFSHAPAFSKRYRVTLYDLRGHGRSGATESGYTVANMALDLEQFLDRLGIKRAHFAAHSFGGAVTLNLACRNPGRFSSLMLFDTQIHAVRRAGNGGWKSGEMIQRVLDQNKLQIDVRDPYFGYRLLTEVARLKLGKRPMTQELQSMLCPLMGKSSSRTADLWLTLIRTTRAGQELMDDDGLSLDILRKLDFPILAVYGEHSQAMTTGEQLLEAWPHADFRIIRGAGHFFPVTRPDDFMRTCREFWNGALQGMVPRRRGESGARCFRRDRFYAREGKWFLDMRKAPGNGPFDDLDQAMRFLETGQA
jgi:pimeloyl-ACP methyl ester carboxylesterase